MAIDNLKKLINGAVQTFATGAAAVGKESSGLGRTERTGSTRTATTVQAPEKSTITVKLPQTQSARQKMMFQEEEQEKWYRGDEPTSSEIMARIYHISQSDPATGEQLWNNFQAFQSDPASPVYNPYTYSTNKAATELANLGYDMSGGITQQWLTDNAYLKNHYRTVTGVTPLAPSSSSTKEQDAAYWYYKATEAEQTTQQAETEWSALQEEIKYWTGRGDRNYSDEEVLARIDWSNYPTLVRMDEDREKGTPTVLNRSVGYSQDALYGVIWAARNQSTGNSMLDCVKAALGHGNTWQEDSDLAARLDPTNAAYSPYAAGSTVDDAALYFGVSEFPSDWLENNRAYLAGNDAAAKRMYQLVYDAEQTTLDAEKELESVWSSVDERLKYTTDPDVILSGLLDGCPTLKRMDKSRKNGDLLATTRAVDYRWEDVEAEVRRRCADVNTANQGGSFIEQVGAVLGLSLSHSESDMAMERSRDNAINAGAATIMAQGTDEEKSVFQTAYSSNFDTYLLEINTALNEGVTDPQGGYMYCLERADEYASQHYLDAKAVVAPYEAKQQEVQAAEEELAALESQLWVQQELHYGNESESEADAPLRDNYHAMMSVDGGDWEFHAERIEGTNQYRFVGVYNVETGEFLDPTSGAMSETLSMEGEMFAKSLSHEEAGVTTERSDYTPEEREAIVARAEELDNIVNSGRAYLESNAQAYSDSNQTMQLIDNGYAVADRMAALAGLEKGDSASIKAVLDFVYTLGAEYKPTNWAAQDLYTAAMEQGYEYATVSQAALQGKQENENAISQIDRAFEWLDRNNVEVDQTYLDNIARERARLAREVKAADYFVLQGNEDFDSVVQQTKANMETPGISFGLSDEWLVFYAVYPESDLIASEGRPSTQMYFMTQMERDTFLYLYSTAGIETAKEYYNYLTDENYGVVPVRNTVSMQEMMADFARDYPIGSTIVSVISSPLQIAGTLYSGYSFLTGQEVSPYHPAFGPTTMVGAIRGTVKDENLERFGDAAPFVNFLYDAGTGMGDSLVNAYAFGGLGGAASMAMEGASGTIQDAKLRGGTDDQALLLGGITAAVEMLTESAPMENLDKALLGGDTVAAKGILHSLFQNAGVEGLGEATSSLVSNVSDAFIMGEYEKWKNASPEERDQATKDFICNVLYEGAVGFVSGGMSETMATAIGSVNRRIGQQNATLPGVENADTEAETTSVGAEDPSNEDSDLSMMTDIFGPDAIEAEAAAQQNGILARQLAALSAAMTTADEASVAATIGAVLAPAQGTVYNTSMASAAAQKMVASLGAVPAVTIMQDALLTAAESGIPMEQVQLALTIATLAEGQSKQVLAEAAAGNAMNQETVARLISAAQADMQNEALMQQVNQVVTDNQVATRVAAIVADGGLEGIASYETAVRQARTNLQNAQEALEQAKRQQTAAVENLQSTYSQFAQEPGNQQLRGASQQAIKDAEGAVKVVTEYQQSVANAETGLQGAEAALAQMRDSTMRKIRQQAQQEVLAAKAYEAEQEAVMMANAEAAAVNVEQNIQTVAEMEPVATLNGDEFVMENGLRQNVMDFFQQIGSVMNPELGEISLTKSGVKSSFGHGMTPEKAAAFAAVPTVLESGKVIDAQANWKGRDADTFVIAAPISFGEMGESVCAAIVSRNRNGQRYYLHEVRFVDNTKGGDAALLDSAPDTKPGGVEGESKTHPIDIVLDKVLGVKRRKREKGVTAESPIVDPGTKPGGVEDLQSDPNDIVQEQPEDTTQQDATSQKSNMKLSKATPQQQPQGVYSASKGAPKQSPARIAKDLVKTLGLGDAVGTKRMNHVPQAVAGYYETRAKYIAVRSRRAGDYTVTMHELFHNLADRLNMTGTKDMVDNLDPVFAANYAPAELPGEAFAEFGWRYMEDEALARQFAGDAFVDQFEARLRRAGLDKTIHKAAQQLRAWLNATVNERIGATIVDKSKAAKPEGLRAQFRAMVSKLIDDTAAAEPVNAAIRTTTGQNKVSIDQDVRANALMKNFAARRAYAILTESMTDANWNVIGDSLATRFERVGLRAKDAKLLNEYMLALHSLDRDAQDKPVFDIVSITPAQRERLIDDVRQNHPEVAAAEQEFQTFRKEFLQAFLVDTGFLSQADFDTMNGMYPHYVPTFRVKDGVKQNRGNSKTYRIKRATGSTEDIINPMDSFVSMVDSIVTMISANNAALAWDNAYRQNESLGVFGRNITPDMHQISVNVSELQDQIAQLLAGKTEDDVFRQVIDLVGTRQTQWVPQDGTNMANVLTVQRADGSLGYYEIFEPELYKLLASQRDGSGSSNKLWATVGKITRTMTMLTTGSNPVFAVRNFMRDFQNSVNYGSWASNYGTGMAKWIRASYDVWRRSGDYQDYIALGGGGWTRIEAGTKKGAREYRSALYKGYNTSTVGDAAKWVGEKVWNTLTLSRLNEVIEQTSRFAEYKYGKHDKTTSEGKTEAFLAAQDVTVDFARMGNSGAASVLKQIVPFLGASVQGVYRTGRSVTHAERSRAPQRFAKTVINTALTSAISAAIMLKYSDDEEKEAFVLMSDDLKSQHLYFPNFAKSVLGQQPLIRVPLAQDPLTYAIHGAVTNAMWNGTTDEMVIDLAAIANTIVDNLNPFGSGTVFEPMLAVTRNRNWYGSRIVPSYMSEWDVTTQYTEETPGIFIAAGRVLGMSPLNVQYLAEQYTGFLGQMAIPALSKDSSGDLEGWEATKTAIQKRFTSDPLISNDVVSCVYDNASFLTQVTSAAKNGRPANMLRRGLSEEEQKAAYDEAYTLTHKGGVIADAKTFISDGYARIEDINANDTLTPEQKYTLTSEVRREMVQVSLEANEAAADYKVKYVSGLNIANNALYEGSYLAMPTAMDKLAATFKADSDQTYMQRATAVWEATGDEDALPHPNLSYTSSGVTYTVDEADMDNWMLQYKMGYQDYLVKKGKMWDSMSDVERLEMLKDAHSAGHDAAKKWHMKLHGIK